MAQRGRKSIASLSVITPISDHRPSPPAELTQEQAAEWEAIVRRLPSDWFPRETHGLLVAFCKHLTTHRVLCGMIESFEAEWLARDDGLARYDRLLTMREREGRAMSSLATRLRITNQSRQDAKTAFRAAAGAGSGIRPWEKHA